MAIAPNLCEWPHPRDPGYHSAEYAAQKQREAERMLDQIEQHIPGFRQHIRTLIIGTPTTIERYLLKNGGAVGGPKNQIGQEMLKRLHARSEWKHLYFCGDSTVMGTGAPATMVSGVGAANVILRELHLPEYDSRKFSKQYVHLVELPYRRPGYDPADEITEKNAYLAASQCQGCQEPACVAGCPVGIDIPGFMRRMEAKNYTGAARVIREKNPLGEVCGILCAADRLCQRSCYRRDFSGKLVRIAELQRWVCANAGKEGWWKADQSSEERKVAVIGGGPSALSCSYYLSLAGIRVSTMAQEDQPGGMLRGKSDSSPQLRAAVQRDVQGILSDGIDYQGGMNINELDLHHLLDNYSAVYVAGTRLDNDVKPATNWSGTNYTEAIERQIGEAANFPGVFLGKEFLNNGVSVVEAAAEGRRAAMAILEFLNTRA